MAEKKKKSFLDELEELCEKYNYLEEDKDVMIPTGLLSLDYGNGKRIKAYDENNNIVDQFDQIGVVMGAVNGVTGESSTGKSAVVYSAAGSIVGGYKGADCHVFDAENSFDKERFKTLTSLSATTLKKHLKIHKTNVVETVAEEIIKIAKAKLENINDNTIETDYRNMFGEKISMLKPDVAIVDSWSVLQPRDHIEKALLDGTKQEFTNNMQAATRAKTNNAIVKLLNRLAMIANITIFLIHHTQETIQAGFISKAAQNMHLGGSKSMGGGKSSVYLSSVLLETSNLGKIYKDKQSPNYGVDGFIVGMKVAKSRTNSTGKVLPAVFDYKYGGFNRLLTLFHFACINNIPKGSAQKMYFESCPDIQFSKKTFETVTRKNPVLINVLFDECKEALTSLLSNIDNKEVDDDIDILSSFMF